ncbi:MAG: YolD-like family protein [Blautia sp.]|nr:YolD-like family protein [Blautia sp.]MDY4516741.1 hypothetical protein [Lachnospiraceae bacterium]
MSGNIKKTCDDSHSYDDIIHLPRHVSATHPHMAIRDRAAQFSPFAALTGHDAAVRETARLTEEKVELDEYSREELDERLQMVQKQIRMHPALMITYFQPDEQKDGGSYVTVAGNAGKIDLFQKVLVLTDGTRIPLGDILTFEITDDRMGTCDK